MAYGTDILLKDVPEELVKYLNDTGFAELCQRGKFKRFSKYKKLAFDILDNSKKNVPEEVIQKVLGINQAESRRMLGEVVKQINNGFLNNSMNYDKLLNQGKFLIENAKILNVLSWVNIGLNVANLCVTAAGFAVVNKKLNTVIAEINNVKAKLEQMNAAGEIKTLESFEKVISRYSMMLDRKRIGRPLSEDELAELIDEMYHTLNVMQRLFVNDVFENKAALLDAIYALTPMYAQTLIRYDRVYYFANKNVLGSKSKFHSDHDKWLNLFDEIYSDRFLDSVQDYCILDKKLNNRDASEAVALSFYAVFEAKQDVLDGQKLLLQTSSAEEYNNLVHLMDGYMKSEFEKELSETDALSPEELKALLSGVFEQYELQQQPLMA